MICYPKSKLFKAFRIRSRKVQKQLKKYQHGRSRLEPSYISTFFHTQSHQYRFIDSRSTTFENNILHELNQNNVRTKIPNILLLCKSAQEWTIKKLWSSFILGFRHSLHVFLVWRWLRTITRRCHRPFACCYQFVLPSMCYSNNVERIRRVG